MSLNEFSLRKRSVSFVSLLRALMSVIQLVWRRRTVRFVRPLNGLMSVIDLLLSVRLVSPVRFWRPTRLSNGAVAIWGFGLCGCFEIQESISHYYDLRTRDAFVGILFVIAIFMFAYQGYEDDANDDFAGNLVCIFALGVALFPISGASWEQVVHVASALGLFSTLAYFCLVLFTKSGPTRTPKKEKRNRVYVACGWTMVVSILLAGLASWLLDAETIAAIKPVFYLESIAIGAFSISWFTKGGTLWRDDP
jgi:phosphatidylserine synthase